MTSDDIRGILAQGEGISIEFKRCGNLPEIDTFETICSFANRQGGNILLGIVDAEKSGTGKPEVIGVDPAHVVEIERNIANRLNDPISSMLRPLSSSRELNTGIDWFYASGWSLAPSFTN